MQILLSTTGTLSNVTINDFGGRVYTHPTTNYNILEEYTIELVRDSSDLQLAITNGYITLKDEFNTTISDLKKITLSQYFIDKNNNNIADDSDKFNGNLPTYYLNRANHTGTQLSSSISDFNTSIDAAISNKTLNDLADVDTTGVANNYIIKYNSSNSTQIASDYTTLGSGAAQNYYEKNATITSPTVTSTQQTRTLEYSNAFTFVTIYNSGESDRTVGIRRSGSSEIRTFTIKHNNVATYTTVTNASKQIEIYSSHTTGLLFKVIGYIV